MAKSTMQDCRGTKEIINRKETKLGNNTYTVAARGKYLYLANGDAGLKVLDITRPENPELVYEYDTAGYCTGFDLQAHYLYVINGWSFLIFSLNNPARPELIATLPTVYIEHVTVVGKYAYIAAYAPELLVVDISIPEQPVPVASIPTEERIYEIASDGKYLYVADDAEGLLLFSLANPAEPMLAGTLKLPKHCRFVALKDKKAYVTALAGGLHVVDIREPNQPALLYTHQVDSQVVTVCMRGKYVYGAFWDRFKVLEEVRRRKRRRG